VFGRSLRNHIFGQLRRGRRFIPIERFQIIAHKLLVETRWALADDVLIARPKTRGIWREAFVDQEQLSIDNTELEFRVRYDDAALRSMIAAGAVNLQTQIANVLCHFVAQNSPTLVHVDVEIVSGIALCRWRE